MQCSPTLRRGSRGGGAGKSGDVALVQQKTQWWIQCLQESATGVGQYEYQYQT
jgi:hypothetical protein